MASLDPSFGEELRVGAFDDGPAHLELGGQRPGSGQPLARCSRPSVIAARSWAATWVASGTGLWRLAVSGSSTVPRSIVGLNLMPKWIYVKVPLGRTVRIWLLQTPRPPVRRNPAGGHTRRARASRGRGLVLLYSAAC